MANFRQKVGEFSKNIPSQHRFRKKISFSCCEGSGKRLNLRAEKHRSIYDIAPDGAENRGLMVGKFAEVGGTMAEWFRASAPPGSGVERVERGGEGVLQERAHGHGAYSAGHRGDGAGNGGDGIEIDIAHHAEARGA